MSFEHGSQSLGIKNPFKFEGSLRAVRGALTSLLGIYLLTNVAGWVQEYPMTGWTYALLGFTFLADGLWILGRGLMQLTRFMVGRSAPTSLSYNHHQSNQDSARAEQSDLGFNQEQMESMLESSKNYTFLEPKGLAARLLHTLFPKITFVPYPIINLAQRLTGAFIQTAVALLCFALLLFTTSVGLVGATGTVMMPLFSFCLLVYLILVWRKAGRPINRAQARSIDTIGAGGLAKAIAFCAIVPALIISGVSSLFQSEQQALKDIAALLKGQDFSQVDIGFEFIQAANQNYSNGPWLALLFVLVVASCGLLLTLTGLRTREANPITEVTQKRPAAESIRAKPLDIFTEFSQQIMEKRRKFGVPNRIYKPLAPQQNQQTGEFRGDTLQEIQPEVLAKNDEPLGKKLRIVATSLSQALLLIAGVAVFWGTHSLVEAINTYEASADPSTLSDAQQFEFIQGVVGNGFAFFNTLIAAFLLATFGRLLSNLSHPFWSEILFESTLIHFKCQGTTQMTKRRVGGSIHDANSEEIQSHVTTLHPQIYVSRVITSTFAGTGGTKLQYPRFIMSMHTDDATADEIYHQLISKLSSRSTIVSHNDAEEEALMKMSKQNLQVDAARKQLDSIDVDQRLLGGQAQSALEHTQREQLELEEQDVNA